MGSAREFAMVERLVAEGLNDCDVSRRTGIPRTTVRTGDRTASRSESCGWLPETPTSTTFTRLPRTYGHLLGLYLGDGCISQHPRAVFAFGSRSIRPTRCSSRRARRRWLR